MCDKNTLDKTELRWLVSLIGETSNVKVAFGYERSRKMIESLNREHQPAGFAIFNIRFEYVLIKIFRGALGFAMKNESSKKTNGSGSIISIV